MPVWSDFLPWLSSCECLVTISGQAKGVALVTLARKSWNVSEIENQAIPQLDWLVHELVFRNHGPCDGVPRDPQILPIYNGRDRLSGVQIGLCWVSNTGRRQ